jgi:hypothetical protein
MDSRITRRTKIVLGATEAFRAHALTDYGLRPVQLQVIEVEIISNGRAFQLSGWMIKKDGTPGGKFATATVEADSVYGQAVRAAWPTFVDNELVAILAAEKAATKVSQPRPIDHPLPTAADVVTDQIADRS